MKITSNIKKLIKNYYENKIRKLREEERILEEDYINLKLKEFNTNKKVIQTRKLLSEINEIYDTNFSINLYSYHIKCELSEKVKIKIAEIKELQNEGEKLIAHLEIYPSKSEQYKVAFKKLEKIIKEVT